MGILWYRTKALHVLDRPADARHRGAAGLLVPQLVILHHTGGRDSLHWLTRDTRSNVSVHRLIDKRGAIYKLVEDTGIAHHVGNATMCPDTLPSASTPNRRCLGIEIENMGDGKDPYTVHQYVSVADQVVEWWGLYGYLPVLGHGAIDRAKSDPVGWDWQKCANAIIDAYLHNSEL